MIQPTLSSLPAPLRFTIMNMPLPPPVPMGPVRHVIEVTAARSGLSRAFGLVIGVLLLGIVFIVGVVFGVGGTIAAQGVEPTLTETHRRAGTGDRIVIIPVEGIILEPTADFVAVAVNRVLSDPHVRAVILRVDSPGGAVSPSDRIWRDVQRLRDAGVPVVASFGGYAASGGYYVSCHSDQIVAEPTCITGSIGVISQVLTMGDLLDKVGIQPITLVAAGSPEKAVGNDIYRNWTDADRKTHQHLLDAAYDIFRSRVAEGRGSRLDSADSLDVIGDGRVFTANDALTNRLIDQVGYLEDAIATAEGLARLRPGSATVIRLDAPPTFMSALLSAQRAPTTDATSLRSLLHELSVPRAMYLMH